MVMVEGTAVLRQNRLGTKAQDFYNCTHVDQQHIQQNVRAGCSNIDKILEPPEDQDETEHLKQFCLRLNGLEVKLQSECYPDT
uniref:Uncharacterized protein n=1 Tax=Mandrillus leucophaeus TaxID=9568 RepID=A0A2K5XF20_MANLE